MYRIIEMAIRHEVKDALRVPFNGRWLVQLDLSNVGFGSYERYWSWSEDQFHPIQYISTTDGSYRRRHSSNFWRHSGETVSVKHQRIRWRWLRQGHRSRSNETDSRSPTHNPGRGEKINPISTLEESTRVRWHFQPNVEVVHKQSSGTPLEYHQWDANTVVYREEMDICHHWAR